MDVGEFDRQLDTDGWVLFPCVVDAQLIDLLKHDVCTKHQECRHFQVRNGLAAGTEGTAHHVLGSENSLDEFLRRFYLDAYLARCLEGPYILNSYGAVLNDPTQPGSYVQSIHRDVRTHTKDFRMLVNVLVMLDEFTAENGATWVLSSSHHLPAKPAEAHFVGNADRITGMAGSILLFDSRLWHAAGHNRTDQPRMALTLTFSRPFMKQQMDYPRFVSRQYEAALSERMRQLLGFNARVPATYDEWYQPPERRMYKSTQG